MNYRKGEIYMEGTGEKVKAGNCPSDPTQPLESQSSNPKNPVSLGKPNIAFQTTETGFFSQ